MNLIRTLTTTIFLLFLPTLVKAQTLSDSTSLKDTVYSLNDVDVKPEYSGGDKARIDFIETKTNLFVPVDNGAPKGTYTVVIACVIGIDGKIIATAPRTNHGYGMEKEVLRIIGKLPKPYKPGIKNGVPVKTMIGFPVTFSVQ